MFLFAREDRRINSLRLGRQKIECGKFGEILMRKKLEKRKPENFPKILLVFQTCTRQSKKKTDSHNKTLEIFISLCIHHKTNQSPPKKRRRKKKMKFFCDFCRAESLSAKEIYGIKKASEREMKTFCFLLIFA